MKRHTTIVSTLALVAGVGLCVPASAAAGGPLLSGYGGPGAGSQAILGAALLGGGSGGSSRGGSGGGSEGAPSSVGSHGAAAAGAGSGVGGSSTSGTRGHGHGARSPAATSAGGSATHPGAAGATPPIPSLRVGPTSNAATPSWFTGADLLALVLAAGVLVLVGLATVRLGRSQHQADGRG